MIIEFFIREVPTDLYGLTLLEDIKKIKLDKKKPMDIYEEELFTIVNHFNNLHPTPGLMYRNPLYNVRWYSFEICLVSNPNSDGTYAKKICGFRYAMDLANNNITLTIPVSELLKTKQL